MPESDLYALIICEATRLGHRLFRNNRGVGRYQRGDGTEGFVPFGLAEGASDLIGWTQFRVWFRVKPLADVQPSDSDTHKFITVPKFTAVEVKFPGKRTKKALLEKQTNFIEAVKAAGGIAGFVESVEDYQKLVGAK